MDKNIDLAARALLSKAFSSELIAAKHNIAYITDPEQRVEIPLRITGQLPKPAVIPDVSVLAQRAATHAAQREVGRLLDKKAVYSAACWRRRRQRLTATRRPIR